jgi:hypothetical protein
MIMDYLKKHFTTIINPDEHDYMFKLFEKVKDNKIPVLECVKSNHYKELAEFAEVLKNEHTKTINRYYETEKLNKNEPELFNLFFISDYLSRSEDNGIELDSDELLLKKELEEFEFYKKFLHLLVVSTENIYRLGSSCLYRTLLSHFDEKIEGNTKNNIILLSAHDMNLCSLAVPLEIENINYDFNDELTYILYKSDDKFYVGIEYNSEKVPLKISNGGFYCEYSVFKDFIRERINEHDDILKYLSGEITCLKSKK